MDKHSLFVKGVLAALVVALLVFGDYFQPLAHYFQSAEIKTLLAKAGSVAPLVCMILMALAVIIPFIPTLLLDGAAGAFFGPVLGTIYCAAGALGELWLPF